MQWRSTLLFSGCINRMVVAKAIAAECALDLRSEGGAGGAPTLRAPNRKGPPIPRTRRDTFGVHGGKAQMVGQCLLRCGPPVQHLAKTQARTVLVSGQAYGGPDDSFTSCEPVQSGLSFNNG